MNPPVFVVSTGRAGSKMLAHVMRVHPAICALHEPQPQLNSEAFAKWSRRAEQQRILQRVKMKRSGIIQQIRDNGLEYFESAHFCSHLIPELDQLFGAKFIHIHREGLEFVASGLQRGWYGSMDHRSAGDRAKHWIAHRLVVDVGNPGLLHRLEPPRSLGSRFERIAWLWAEINGIILDAFELIPEDRKLSLRLAEFDAASVSDMHRFVGVEPTQESTRRMLDIAASRPNHSPQPDRPVRITWTQQERERYQAIAGPVAKRLGY